MPEAKTIHMANAKDQSICSRNIAQPVISTDPTEVTCKHCLSKLDRDADR